MKKLFYALMVLVSVTMFTACGGNDPKDPKDLDNTTWCCWELTAKWNGQTEVSYVWATEYIMGVSVETAKKEAEKQGITNYSVTYKKNNAKDEDACDALNPDEPTPVQTPKCWKITYATPAATLVEYSWGTTTEMDAYVAILAQAGYTATYVEADAKDEDSCKALNQDTPDPKPEEFDGSQYDNITNKCWEVVTLYGDMSVTHYVWGTEYAIAYTIWAEKLNATFSAAVDAADEDACETREEAIQGDDACYQIIISYGGATQIQYVWTNQSNITAIIGTMRERFEAMPGATDVNIAYEIANAEDEDACEALQQAVEDEFNKSSKCWELNAIFMGQTLVTYYVWCPEELLASVVENAKQTFETQFGMAGVEITYKQAAATDEEACEALNPDEDDEVEADVRAMLKGVLGK